MDFYFEKERVIDIFFKKKQKKGAMLGPVEIKVQDKWLIEAYDEHRIRTDRTSSFVFERST